MVELPVDPMQARMGGTLDAVDYLPVTVPDHKRQTRCFFTLFLFQGFPTRIRGVTTLFFHLRLLLAPLLLASLQAVTQVVGEHSTVRGICGCVETIAPASLLAPLGDIERRGADGEQSERLLVQRLLVELAQEAVIVEYVEPAPKGGADQVAFAALDFEVPEGNRGRVALDFQPVLSRVQRNIEAELGAQEAEMGIHVVLYKTPEDLTCGQVSGDRLPGHTTVCALDEIGLEVAEFVGVQHRVHGVDIVQIGLDVVDKGLFRNAVETFDPTPVCSSILGHLDQAVIRAHVDKPLPERRLRDRGYVAVLGHGRSIVDGIETPDSPHVLALITVALAGQVGTNRNPGVAPVVAAVQLLGAKIEAGVRVWADQDGRIPIETQVLFTLARTWANVHGLTGTAVYTPQIALLRFTVECVRVFRIDSTVVTVTANNNAPVAVGDAGAIGRATGAVLGGIILCSSYDIIEGPVVVGCHLIELRQGEIAKVVVGPAAVKRPVQPTVAADQ